MPRKPIQVGRASLWSAALTHCLLLPAVPLAAQHADEQSVARELASRIELLRANGSVRLEDEVIRPPALTLETYEDRGYVPLWSNRAAVDSLLRAVADSWKDGLDPEDYHLSHLAVLAGASRMSHDASNAADLDLLCTAALLRLGHDLRFGKVQPRGPASRVSTPWLFGGPDAVAHLVDVVTSGRILGALDTLRPHHFAYEGLRRELALLRAIRASGGWEAIPGGPALALDSVDTRVPMIRRRLIVEGDLGASSGDSGLRFDSTLDQAVKAFQARHGLNEDGVVGNSTLDALNVPVERRIDQVRVNLERARWITHELPDTLVAVNVAGARVYLLYGDSVAFRTRAIVGTEYKQTPLFEAPMLYIELNPTWTVPEGVVGEILGMVQRDPGYLKSQGMRVLDKGGTELDPSEIDFSSYTADDFPYVFRQDPGSANALGRIKLMFPNPESVYLHDTPTKGLFARETRLFSHGCIRIQDPLGLAELVLGDSRRWNRMTLQAAIDTGITRAIALTRPVRVFVLYWTASADAQGVAHFYRDVYERDAAILAELDAPVDAGTSAEGAR